MKKLLLALLVISATFFSVTAQEAASEGGVEAKESSKSKTEKPKYSHWSLTLGGGMSVMDGDQSQQRHELFPYSSILGGGVFSLAYDFNPRVGLFAQYSYLSTKAATTYYPNSMSTAGSQAVLTNSYVHNMSLNVSINLATLLGRCFDNPKWAIYANVGMGVALYNISVFNESQDSHDYGLSYRGGYAGFIPVGFSVEYTPIKWLGIFWDGQYNYYLEDDLDSSVKGNTNDGIFYTGLVVRFKFSSKNRPHVRNLSWCQYADKENQLEEEIAKLKKRADDTDKEVDALKDEVEKLKSKKPEPPAPSLTEADVERMMGAQPSRACEPEIPAVYFNVNSYQSGEQARNTIAQVAQRMYADKSLKLELRGYCDYTGTESYNEKLSLERAEQVKRALVNEYGIDASRISVKGMGKTMGPKESYLPNRRCEFLFTK